MNFIFAVALLFQIGTASTGDFHSDLKKATFALYERKWNNDALEWNNKFICSAIAVAEEDSGYLLLTAGHCFEDKDEPNVRYLVSEESSLDPTLQSVEIVKQAETDKYDYAVLYLETPRVYPVFKISFADLPPTETPVVNENFSFGITKQLAKGYIASRIMTSDEGNHCDMCRGRYVATLGIGPGASGSAVVTEDTHEVIGLVEGVFPGFAIGAIIMPMGHNFDDFTVDGTVMDKPITTDKKPEEKTEPEKSSKWTTVVKYWNKAWHWIWKYLII